MMRPVSRSIGRPALMALAAAAAIAIAACGSSTLSSPPPGATNQPPAATTSGGEPTEAPVAGEPCSFLAAEAIGTIIGTVPVEVAERVGRGDCDYWLNAAKDSKVNIGVTTGADAQSVFDSTKGIGDPQPVSLGDEAYSIYNPSIGTLVVVRQGDSVATVQLLTSEDAAAQLVKASALAAAVLAGI